ncbi:hypothetical protein QBC41DRAFT_385489 [Cercophora samala]|uniref:Uncharacterized protein n=1 Tax=Cercophora samala TaxID=330535 RepID=A0AA39ZI56_9PEZI|nr:hypothetical protein QBC41DRAFT_385489 [Cercophora samala]
MRDPGIVPPFLSRDLMIGDDPKRKWRHFVGPRLRHFRDPYVKFEYPELVGEVPEGYVLRVTPEGDDPRRPDVLVKLFIMGKQIPGPFEHEARTAAVLDKIQASSRAGHYFVPARQGTRRDMLRRLYAFSTDSVDERVFDHLPHWQKNPILGAGTRVCFGWVLFSGREIMKLLLESSGGGTARWGIPHRTQDLDKNKYYYGIVYPDVPNWPLEEHQVRRQLSPLNQIGFMFAGDRKGQWSSWTDSGLLMDFRKWYTAVDPWYEGQRWWETPPVARQIMDYDAWEKQHPTLNETDRKRVLREEKDALERAWNREQERCLGTLTLAREHGRWIDMKRFPETEKQNRLMIARAVESEYLPGKPLGACLQERREFWLEKPYDDGPEEPHIPAIEPGEMQRLWQSYDRLLTEYVTLNSEHSHADRQHSQLCVDLGRCVCFF